MSCSTSGLGAEAVMGAQGVSGDGKMPLGGLAKCRPLSGLHQLAPASLGRERALEDPVWTLLGRIIMTMSQAP